MACRCSKCGRDVECGDVYCLLCEGSVLCDPAGEPGDDLIDGYPRD